MYITEHLEDYQEKLTSKMQARMKIRRVVYTNRMLVTVKELVRKYCLISPDMTHFLPPTKEDIMQQQVVIVTTSMAHELVKLQLQGVFTHIFIDEAGQALETEAIMPMCLADKKTCVVLAGDHKQMNPEVFGEEARKHKLHVSLLERLYLHYQQLAVKSRNGQEVTSIQHVIQLHENYRSEPTILSFLSQVFYGGSQVLIPSIKNPTNTTIPCLFFCRSDGEETQDLNATSYYNMYEVDQAFHLVKWLIEHWPQEWGPVNYRQIAVTTSYPLQVYIEYKCGV